MDFDLAECGLDSTPGHYYQLLTTGLSPTQNAIGLDEVNVKVAKIAKKKTKKLKDYLFLRPVPVIIGLGRIHLIDHHHLLRALWEVAGGDNEAGITRDDARVVVQVVENWEHIAKPSRFWSAMDKRNWVYSFDDGGGGPLNVSELKAHVSELTNDPYRSLAWYVRNEFGYFKDPSNPIFAEFKWANFFRTRVQLGDALLDPESDVTLRGVLLEKFDKDDRTEIVNYAVALARSSAASSMPGYFLS